MRNKFRLMCVMAHPDDESLGTGGTLAKYADEGVETFLLTATRGERGRFFEKDRKSPGFEEVGKVREQELLAAAKELKVSQVHFLNYIDGSLDSADPREIIEKIAGFVREIRPQVVITFGPDGGYGHTDHIAISQFTTAALVEAAKPDESGRFHAVAKLYFMQWSGAKWNAYQKALRKLKTNVDGEERIAVPWPDWAITTFIDTRKYWKQAWRAVSCHKTQMAIYGQLENLPEEQHRAIWGTQEFYRVYSLVNGGRKKEADLFEGLH
ncbi:MAG: PIG-L family deacetylase [Calditrichia bacterium]